MNMCGRGDKDIFTVAQGFKYKNIMSERIKKVFSNKEKKLVTFVTGG